MKPSSPAENTLPVGFIGELSSDGLGPRPERRRQRRARQLPVRRHQAHEAGHGAQHPHHRQVGVVQRLDQHHLVARVEQRHQAGGDRLGGAGGHHHLAGRVDLQAVEPGVGGGDRLRAVPARPASGGYWLRVGPSASAPSAWAAARTMSAGPSVSGKPWPRLMAPCCAARADITVKIVVPVPCSSVFSVFNGAILRSRAAKCGHERRAINAMPPKQASRAQASGVPGCPGRAQLRAAPLHCRVARDVQPCRAECPARQGDARVGSAVDRQGRPPAVPVRGHA